MKVSEQWFAANNLIPVENDHPDWGVAVTASTVPLEMWIADKSKIPDKELWLGVNIHRIFDCKANLMTKDKSFGISWMNGYHPDVKSDSIIHRKRTPWPYFDKPDDFLELITSIEDLLKINFIRHLEVNAYSLTTYGVQFLYKWLSSVANSVTFSLGTLYGDISSDLIINDSRSKNSGVTLHITKENSKLLLQHV